MPPSVRLASPSLAASWCRWDARADHQVSTRLLLLLICLLGCTVPATDADRARLAQLETQFGDRYEFEFDGDLYLRVTARDRVDPPVADVEQAYRTFMNRPDGTRRKTSFVYLNVYDVNDKFLYQIHFDEHNGKFGMTTEAEHY